MDFQMLEGVSGTVVALVTVGTAIYGIGSYRRNQKTKLLEELREATESISQIMGGVDAELNDHNYYSLAKATIANLRATNPAANDPVSFIEWLEQAPNEVMLGASVEAQASVGLSNAINQSIRTAQLAIARLNSGFPAISQVLEHAVVLAAKGATPLVSTQIYRNYFVSNRADFLNLLKIQAQRTDSMEEAEVLFGLALASLCTSLTQIREQRDFDAMEEVVSEIAHWVKVEKDSTLNRLAGQASKNANKIKKFDVDSHTSAIKAGAGLLKPYMGTARYKRIVRACETLEAAPGIDDWLETVLRSADPTEIVAVLSHAEAAGVTLPPEFIEKARAMLKEKGVLSGPAPDPADQQT